MTQPRNPVDPPKITDEMRAAAKKAPNTWMYSIDPMLDPDGEVPPYAIRGSFAVDDKGELGEFKGNPGYRPSPRALELSPPENELERAIELAATGYGERDAVLPALLEAELHFIEREEHPGQFAVAQEGDDLVLHAFTASSRRPGNWPRWQVARGRDLLAMKGVQLQLNPGVPAVASVTIPIDDLVELAERGGGRNEPVAALPPDVLGNHRHVVWNNQLLPAQDMYVDHRMAPHARFDRGDGDEPLLLSLVESFFVYTATALTAEGVYEVQGVDGDKFEVMRLGKTPTKSTKPISDFDRIVQVRFDRQLLLDELNVSSPYLVLPEGEQKRPDTSSLINAITDLLMRNCPDPWHTITVECHALVGWQEIKTTLRTRDGDERYWFAPLMVGQWFRRLRAATSTYPHGAWTTARYEISRGDVPTVEYSWRDEPRWHRYFNGPTDLAGRQLHHELLHFPRIAQTTPNWLAAANSFGSLTGLPQSAVEETPPLGNRETHLARMFDGMGENDTPLLFRSPVVPGEKKALLEYLNNGHVVLSGRGMAPDLLDPERPEKVPMVFSTDGRWVWSSSVTYYLEHHDIAPDQAFLAHIRGRGYQLPAQLSSPVRARALAVATDAPELEPALADEFNTAAQAVHAIGEYLNLDRGSYSVGSIVENALCLVRAEDRYVVFWLYGGERRFYAEFDTPGDAATYLIGYMYSYTDALRQPPATQ
jgi:hypothetical protein